MHFLLFAYFAMQFEGHEGSFVLLNGKTGEIRTINQVRAAQRFSPCSTFKIPMAAIALETKVIGGRDAVIAYNSDRDPRQSYWPETWSKDHDLRSAIQVSAVWYFKELARRVGLDRAREFVEKFEYGNQDTSGGVPPGSSIEFH